MMRTYLPDGKSGLDVGIIIGLIIRSEVTLGHFLIEQWGSSMKRVLAAAGMAMFLSACVTGGGIPANGGAALTPAQSALIGDWKGNLPSGKPVRVVVSPAGGASYYFENRLQTINTVKVTSTRVSFGAGSNGSTVTLSPTGAYVFTWGPTGEITRATLSKG